MTIQGNPINKLCPLKEKLSSDILSVINSRKKSIEAYLKFLRDDFQQLYPYSLEHSINMIEFVVGGLANLVTLKFHPKSCNFIANVLVRFFCLVQIKNSPKISFSHKTKNYAVISMHNYAYYSVKMISLSLGNLW